MFCTGTPKITKSSHVIEERKKNSVHLEWASVPNAELYKVSSKVNDFTFQKLLTSDTSCVIDNVNGADTTALWVTAITNGRESLPSETITVPTVTRKLYRGFRI